VLPISVCPCARQQAHLRSPYRVSPLPATTVAKVPPARMACLAQLACTVPVVLALAAVRARHFQGSAAPKAAVQRLGIWHQLGITRWVARMHQCLARPGVMAVSLE
jgi:hypothetical protein